MQKEILDKLEGGKLTDKELDALYLYLDMYMDSMTDEELIFWKEVVSKIDQENYED